MLSDGVRVHSSNFSCACGGSCQLDFKMHLFTTLVKINVEHPSPQAIRGMDMITKPCRWCHGAARLRLVDAERSLQVSHLPNSKACLSNPGSRCIPCCAMSSSSRLCFSIAAEAACAAGRRRSRRSTNLGFAQRFVHFVRSLICRATALLTLLDQPLRQAGVHCVLQGFAPTCTALPVETGPHPWRSFAKLLRSA